MTQTDLGTLYLALPCFVPQLQTIFTTWPRWRHDGFPLHTRPSTHHRVFAAYLRHTLVNKLTRVTDRTKTELFVDLNLTKAISVLDLKKVNLLRAYACCLIRFLSGSFGGTGIRNVALMLSRDYGDIGRIKGDRVSTSRNGYRFRGKLFCFFLGAQ